MFSREYTVDKTKAGAAQLTRPRDTAEKQTAIVVRLPRPDEGFKDGVILVLSPTNFELFKQTGKEPRLGRLYGISANDILEEGE